MAFIPQLFDAIVTNLVAWITGNPSITPLAPNLDLTTGSLELSHLEAVAVQLESLEQRTSQAVLAAVQDSCYHAFGFDQLAATAATGAVVFSALTAPTSDITIPSGTRLVSTTGQVFQTAAYATLSAGSTATGSVSIIAETAGAAGNVSAGSVTTMVSGILGIDLVSNAAPTMGGADAETDEVRGTRFTDYVATLQRGTAYSIEFAVVQNTSASLARVIEPWALSVVPSNSPYAGGIWLFAYDGSTGGLTAANGAAVSQVVNGYTDASGNYVAGWKAAGIDVTIMAAQMVNVDVRGTVTLTPTGGGRWDAIQDNLTAAAQAYFSTLRIGDSVCYQTLTTALNSCDDYIVEVILQCWVDNTVVPGTTLGNTPTTIAGTATPGYPAPLGTVVPYAQDLDPLNATLNPAATTSNYYACGSLCILNQSPANATYPQWVLS